MQTNRKWSEIKSNQIKWRKTNNKTKSWQIKWHCMKNAHEIATHMHRFEHAHPPSGKISTCCITEINTWTGKINYNHIFQCNPLTVLQTLVLSFVFLHVRQNSLWKSISARLSHSLIIRAWLQFECLWQHCQRGVNFLSDKKIGKWKQKQIKKFTL